MDCATTKKPPSQTPNNIVFFSSTIVAVFTELYSINFQVDFQTEGACQDLSF